MKKTFVLLAATLSVVGAAATFVVFSLSYVPALRKLDDQQYVQSMQQINRDIQNPLFLSAFMGAVVLLPVAAFIYRKSGVSRKVQLLIAASALYIIGTFGITSVVNVPLNEQLDQVSVATTPPAQLSTIRKDYETTWTQWHQVRTGIAVVAAGLVIASIFSKTKQPKTKKGA